VTSGFARTTGSRDTFGRGGLALEAFTLVEILLSSGLLALVLGLAFFVLRPRSSTEQPYLDQRAVAAFARLEKRLGESIEILAPPVGRTASEVTFRDCDYRVVTLREAKGATEWASFLAQERESGSEAIQLTPCSMATFTTLSPSLLFAAIQIGSESKDSRPFLTTLRLKNAAQAR